MQRRIDFRDQLHLRLGGAVFNNRWEAVTLWGAALRVVVLLTLLLLASSTLIYAGPLRQTPNQAALVIVHGDGRVVTRCVGFSEAQITGADLLQRSGLDLNIEASSMGATICSIDGEGCIFPQESCFCQCEGASCNYWSYWRWENGEWRYSQLGASNNTVLPGSMDSWVWGAGTMDNAAKPPLISFTSICAPPTPTEMPSSTPTHTESWTPPTPTTTPTLSAPTATDTPTVTSTATTQPTPAELQPSTPVTPNTPMPAATVAPSPEPAPMPPSSPATATIPMPVIEFFGADRREISLGESVTLVWRIRNADAIQLQAFGQTVTVAAQGSMLVAPPQNTTYQLTGIGPGGSVASALTIVVRPAQPQQQTVPSPKHTPVEEMTDAAPAATLTATFAPGVESPDAALLVTLPPATPASTPTSNATPTLAPVALAPLSATSEVAATAIFTQQEAQTPVTPLLVLVGLAVLVGLPLLGVAAFLLVWLVHRPQ